MTIEAGKWYRTHRGDVVRAEEQREWLRGWSVVSLDGRHLWVWPEFPLTPWVPKVGEWVRVGAVADRLDARGLVGERGRVTSCVDGVASVEGVGSALLVSHPGYYHVEPCLPPDEKISGAAVAAAGVAIAPGSDESEVIDYNGACPKCGGPAYVGLNDAECLSEKCERVEPEPMVSQSWVGFCHPPDSDGAVRSEVPPWEDGAEPFWTAYGLGLSVNHPIRNEAIRLWREAVRR